jgi:hypothetical protein
MLKCNICGVRVGSGNKLVEHMRKYHVGKLSKESIEYLKSLGVGSPAGVKDDLENS